MRRRGREVVLVVGCDAALGDPRGAVEGRMPLAVPETWVP